MISLRFFPAIAVVSALAGGLVASSCTPAERQGVALAAGILAGVASSPVPCIEVAAGGATLCGEVSSDVSDVAKLVEDVLASLPPVPAQTPASPAGMKGEETAPVRVDVRGKSGSIVTVTLSPVVAEALQRRLAKKAAAGDAGAAPKPPATLDASASVDAGSEGGR